LRCRRPFTVRRTRQARVTPACAFPCPIRRSSRAAAPSSVPRAPALPRVCAPLGAGPRALRAHAPAVGQVHGARAAHAAAAARRTRSATPRRAPSTCAGLRVRSADRELVVLRSQAPWLHQPCTSALTTLLVRSQRACGAEPFALQRRLGLVLCSTQTDT